MSTTTFQINQSTDNSQLNGTITLELENQGTGSGSASITIGKNHLGPLKMDNWTCYDTDENMIWVFTPDVILELNNKYFNNNNGRNPSEYNAMIGYTFSPMISCKASLTMPGGGSGTGGGNGNP